MKGLKKTVIKKRESGLNLIPEKRSTVFVTGIFFLSEDELKENTENLPVFVLKADPSWHVEPVDPPTKGNFGWFPGNCYLDMEIYGQSVEVAIFDRQETPQEYEFLSRDW